MFQQVIYIKWICHLIWPSPEAEAFRNLGNNFMDHYILCSGSLSFSSFFELHLMIITIWFWGSFLAFSFPFLRAIFTVKLVIGEGVFGLLSLSFGNDTYKRKATTEVAPVGTCSDDQVSWGKNGEIKEKEINDNQGVYQICMMIYNFRVCNTEELLN